MGISPDNGEGIALIYSKTFWGIVVSFVGKAAAVLFNFDLGPDLQADTVDLILTGVSFLGDALAVYGRYNAVHAVTSILPPKAD